MTTMKKLIPFLSFLYFSCNTGNLTIIAELPETLNEVSGIEQTPNSDVYWMINDHGNTPILYGVNLSGEIQQRLKINTNNHDWEDLASDKEGNIYIGDFGNNDNKRKNLSILKISNESLNSSKKINAKSISFYYPEQTKFPPKHTERHFDCESFLFFNDSLFLFTKSRDPKNIGKTNLYKIPAITGHHEAKFVSTFGTKGDNGSWVTSADINSLGNKVVLLTEKSVFMFSNFKSSNFFTGTLTEIPFNFKSQNESVIFKNDSTLFITDEKSHKSEGNFYHLIIE